MQLASLKISAKSVGTLAVVAAVLLLVDAATYMKSSGALQQARTELNAQQDQVANSRRVVEKLATTESEFNALQSRLTMLETSVSKAAYTPTLLKQLENSGKSVHLRVLGVRPEKAPPVPNAPAAASSSGDGPAGENAAAASLAKKKPDPYDTLRIDIDVEGGYWNVMSFLQKLTSFPKIMAVDSIQISPNSLPGRAKNSPSLTVQMRVRAFVFPEDAQLASGVMGRHIKPAARPNSAAPRVSTNKWRSEHETG